MYYCTFTVHSIFSPLLNGPTGLVDRLRWTSESSYNMLALPSQYRKARTATIGDCFDMILPVTRWRVTRCADTNVPFKKSSLRSETKTKFPLGFFQIELWLIPQRTRQTFMIPTQAQRMLSNWATLSHLQLLDLA